MYLVNEEYKESLVKKAVAMDHTINTSLLESVEKVNPFVELEIVENIDFNDVDKYNDKSCVFMFSRDIHNINDMFFQFIVKFNICPVVKKCNKTNLMEFHLKIGKDNVHIFCCDPNDINIITYNIMSF